MSSKNVWQTNKKWTVNFLSIILEQSYIWQLTFSVIFYFSLTLNWKSLHMLWPFCWKPLKETLKIVNKCWKWTNAKKHHEMCMKSINGLTNVQSCQKDHGRMQKVQTQTSCHILDAASDHGLHHLSLIQSKVSILTA